MKLARALKDKNKRAKKVATLINRMTTTNSYLEGATPAYDSREVFKEIKTEIYDFVAFKTALFDSTSGIRAKIFLISELKNLQRSISIMPVQDGPVQNHYSTGTVTNYKANIKEADRDKILQEIESEIEKLQDEIDTYNATTELNEF